VKHRHTVSGAIVLCAVWTATAEIRNGGFDVNGPIDGCAVDSWECNGTVDAVMVGSNRAVRLGEPGRAGLSRIVQECAAPHGSEVRFSFRYAPSFVANEPGGQSAPVPDSFTASLYAIDSGGLTRHTLTVGDLPNAGDT
jgi:hypothetical protein